MYNLTHLSEAWRIFKRSRYVKKYGIKKYEGNAKEICRQIVEDCWNGRYFQTSSGHFCEFYIRDFGWTVDSLIKLGYKKEVHSTLKYALDKFSKDRLTTTITPEGKCVDIFTYSVDSLPFLIRSLRVAKAKDLIEQYRDFLDKETKKCFKLCFNPKTSLVTTKTYFSSMKDESKRSSSLNDNVMIAMLSEELDKIGLFNPFRKYDIKGAILRHLWEGSYFYDDINKFKIITGDSNVLPFWTEVFDEEEMIKICVDKIRNEKLDHPFPLKYTSSHFSQQKMNIVEKFVRKYERDSIWMHMGLLYIQMVKRIDKGLAKKYVDSYTQIIEGHRNFLEVFHPDGRVYKSTFYYADEGMLWAANYLTLLS
jgi:PII-like signaling protein